jgi:riboflavin synthase
MFTGIIEDVGEVERIERLRGITRLQLKTNISPSQLRVGESISVDGVCLTITRILGRSFQVELSTETRERTTLGSIRPGQKVNLERALRLEDRIGGHFVQGHVDGIGTVIRKERDGDQTIFHIKVPEEIASFIVPKGSVAVDGISLTVNSISRSVFSVTIIPHTARSTTIDQKGPGSRVNIESDIIGRYIENLLKGGKIDKGNNNIETLTIEFLKRHGFA